MDKPVDLTKCQPGDLLRMRSHGLAVYCGTDGTKWMPHSFCPVNSGSAEYAHDNGMAIATQYGAEFDIVAIVHPTRAELEEQRRGLLSACKAILAERTGSPKPCGHEHDCICAGDMLVAAIARAEATHEG